MTLSERTAYLKGLAEGLGLGNDTTEKKILTEVISILGDMAKEIENTANDCDTLYDYAQELDEDLGAVEEELFGYEDDEDYEDDDFCEVECPSCGKVICFDEDTDPSEVKCPACGTEFDCTCDCDCGCGCGCEDENEDK